MKKHFLSFILLLLVASAIQAQGNKIKFVEYDLPNGLHVILHEDHTTPIVAVSVLYHVGSKNEKPERTGFAHFFEHLLFEGSDNIERGEFDKYIQRAGGTLNANTSWDRTFYYEVLPSNQPIVIGPLAGIGADVPRKSGQQRHRNTAPGRERGAPPTH